MFCTKCGNPLEASHAFCGKCGAPAVGKNRTDSQGQKMASFLRRHPLMSSILVLVALISIANMFGGSAGQGAEDQAPGAAVVVIAEDEVVNAETEESGTAEVPVGDTVPGDYRQTLWLVSRVVDGDTIEVTGDTVEKVRLIGVDTPETVDPRKPVECFGLEASAYAKSLLEGEMVQLVSDDTQDDRDVYERLLRYVILEDGTNVNLELIKGGYAYEYTYQVPYKYQSEFKQAQKDAEKSGAGLWADNACKKDTETNDAVEATVIPAVSETPASDESKTVVEEPVAEPSVSAECYCSSNSYNCGDFSTHAQAQTLYECCMKSVGYDVHRLDGNDKDGMACESLS